jgi:hypothetical protein
MLNLNKIAAKVAALQLSGPFRKANESELANAVSFELPQLELANKEFESPLNISIKIQQYHEDADSEVGFEGRDDIQEFTPVAINGLMLESPKDQEMVYRLIYKYVMDHEKQLVKAVSSNNA